MKSAAIFRAIMHNAKLGEHDLSVRQLAVFGAIYSTDTPRELSVRELAAELQVSKPAITRALDRLTVLSLVRRGANKTDRRLVSVQRTQDGDRAAADLDTIVATAMKRAA